MGLLFIHLQARPSRVNFSQLGLRYATTSFQLPLHARMSPWLTLEGSLECTHSHIYDLHMYVNVDSRFARKLGISLPRFPTYFSYVIRSSIDLLLLLLLLLLLIPLGYFRVVATTIAIAPWWGAGLRRRISSLLSSNRRQNLTQTIIPQQWLAAIATAATKMCFEHTNSQ